MELTAIEWDEFITARQGHLLQSWAWGELKQGFGWTAVRLREANAAAQILFRRLPLGFTIAYIPKGPVVDWADSGQDEALLARIHTEARQRRAIFLKVEPDVPDDRRESLSANLTKAALDFLGRAGFKPADTIQPRTSLVIDLSGTEESILAAMKQKTRYNIRLAQKKGVVVRRGEAADVAIFHHLATITAERNEFGVHSRDYYRTAYNLFAPERCALFIAEFEAQPIAALMAFRQGPEAYYFYGASSSQQRQLMAPYLIQWEAMRWAKHLGCHSYDLWGIPDVDLATLEAEFQQRHDGLWGVYRFKRGFGGQYRQSLRAYDYVYNPLFYQFYKLRRRF